VFTINLKANLMHPNAKAQIEKAMNVTKPNLAPSVVALTAPVIVRNIVVSFLFG
jgi:hypothetical protein